MSVAPLSAAAPGRDAPRVTLVDLATTQVMKSMKVWGLEAELS